MSARPVAAGLTPAWSSSDADVYAGDCLDVLRALPDASVDSVVTDPPYGLSNTTPGLVVDTLTRWVTGDREYVPDLAGFVGCRWDAFVPPPAVWDECLRVLKPGGHLLAFAGSRTADLMSLSIRLAGFEIRDSIAWLYGSGFPKSRDASEAMAAFLAGDPGELSGAVRASPFIYAVTSYLRAARDAAGWTNRRIDGLFGTNGMAGHWTSSGSQPSCPSLAQWARLKTELAPHLGDDVDHLVDMLAATERPADWGSGDGKAHRFLSTLKKNPDATPAGGWGTALKPAFEPMVVARKPLAGTVATNVLQYGTGALNIDACRTSERVGQKRPDGSTSKSATIYGKYDDTSTPPHDAGRWPTNVILDDHIAAELDRQAPDTEGAAPASGPSLTGPTAATAAYGARGGASRFFPVFRWEAKAPSSQRPRLPDGTVHPTVKPLDLMRWLVRLVTPPGGVILEPFAGSGTTVEAALVEGFECIGIERDPDYLRLIEHRLSRPLQPVLGIDLGDASCGGQADVSDQARVWPGEAPTTYSGRTR